MRIPSATQSSVRVRPFLPLHLRRALQMKVFAGDPFTVKLTRSSGTTVFAAGVWKNALIPLQAILAHPSFWPNFLICLTCFLTYKLAWRPVFRTQNRLIEALFKLKQPPNQPKAMLDGHGWVEFLKPRLRVLFVLLLLLFIGKSSLHLLEKTLAFPSTKAMQHLIR